MIPKQTIDEIFETAVIEDVINEFVPLKKRGANFLGNCPFHNEKTPSFTVSPAKGIYKCFGCGKAGNAVNFIMEHEHYTYPEALRFLANKYNIEIEEEEQTDEQKIASNERESLYIVSNYAAHYFKKQLHETNEGKAIGLSYFKERGFRDDIIEKFQLGYSPEAWSAFTDAAEKEGYNLNYLEKTGLTIVKDDKKFDRFKGRVVFPIHNLSGRVLGFGGRVLKKDEKTAKYLNSPESEIYHKSKVLYGIFFAKKSITQQDNCFLVEGYTDVISLHQSGIENVVASSGTSLTEGQIRLIKRFTPNITILYDGDEAGIKASFRGINMILQEGMNVRVVLFPDGEDPDSYAKAHTTEELTNYLNENTQDFIRFKADVLIKEVGNDPIKKSELIKDIVESIAIIPDQIKRSVYTKECSTLLEVSEQALINEANKILRKNFNKKSNYRPEIEDVFSENQFQNQKEEEINQDDIPHWEREVIRLLVNYGNKTIPIAVQNEDGKTESQEILVAHYCVSVIVQDELKFEKEDYQTLFDFCSEKLSNEQHINYQEFMQNPESKISDLIIDLLSIKYELSPNWQLHFVNPKTEEDLLKNAIIDTVNSFKLSKIKKLKFENQEKIKQEKNEDELQKLIGLQLHFDKLIKLLTEKLGIIVLK